MSTGTSSTVFSGDLGSGSIEYDDRADVTLIRWMLSLSPEERLAVLQGFVDSAAELTRDPPATQVKEALEVTDR